MKFFLTILSILTLALNFLFNAQKEEIPTFVPPPSACESETGINKIICLADAFKNTLSTSQVTTVQLPYTFTDAAKWSNLPDGLGGLKRVGLRFSTLTATQLAAAKELLKAVTSTISDEGYPELEGLLAADAYLGANGGGATYGSGSYFIAFLGTPAKTGVFEIQFGGHHYTFGITYNNGKVIGATPQFRGAEPAGTFTQGGVTYQPLLQEKAAFAAALTALSASEATSAKLGSTFSDILLGPGKDNQFPTAKQGIKVGTLSAATKTLVLEAIKTYVNDLSTDDAALILAKYQAELDETYLAFSGTTSMSTKNDYIRIDGPSVWIEYSTQGGIVIKNVNHPHSVWRDRKTDYANGKVVAANDITSFEGAFSVYPNPSQSDASAKIMLEKEAQLTVNLIDMTGRTVATIATQTYNAGENTLALPLERLPSGIYQCVVEVKTTSTLQYAIQRVTKL
jgi:Protein of unknown function (DUF3500)/Secretion system C-terminal sorting domain